MDHTRTDSLTSARDLELAREDAIQALGVHFASDDITVEELDRRLTLAIRAATRTELRELLGDLPMLPDYARGPDAVSRAEVVTSTEVPPRGMVGAFMGGTSRKGNWYVPRHIKVAALMGGVELDMSTARFSPGITEVEAYVLMGGVDVIVPHGVRVEVMGFTIMGGIEADAGEITAYDPDQPVLRLTGLVIMGGVHAHHKKPSTRKLKKFEKQLGDIRRRGRTGSV